MDCQTAGAAEDVIVLEVVVVVAVVVGVAVVAAIFVWSFIPCFVWQSKDVHDPNKKKRIVNVVQAIILKK